MARSLASAAGGRRTGLPRELPLWRSALGVQREAVPLQPLPLPRVPQVARRRVREQPARVPEAVPLARRRGAREPLRVEPRRAAQLLRDLRRERGDRAARPGRLPRRRHGRRLRRAAAGPLLRRREAAVARDRRWHSRLQSLAAGARRRQAMNRLQGKVALITGAARGLGLAIAKRFVEEGASVVILNDLDLEATEKAAAPLGGVGLAADVSSSAAVKRMFETVAKRFGRLDVLVNNAGISGVENDPELRSKFRDKQLLQAAELPAGGPIKTHLDSTVEVT